MDFAPKSIPATELAARLGARLIPSSPDAVPASSSTREIRRVSSIPQADPFSLIFAEDAHALTLAFASPAAAVLIPPGLAPAASPNHVLLVTAQPRLAFVRAAHLLVPPVPFRGIHPKAAVDPTARLGDQVSVGAFAVIEPGAILGPGTHIGPGAVVGAGVVLGAACEIYPRVVLYPGTTLGDRVIVHAGAVLGSDGFGYVRDQQTGAYLQFPQQGTLVIEDDVEIGANTTIDRGALEETRIARGVKLDNLVHIGHNVQVGEDVVIAAQTGISGSSTIGRAAVIAGQVGVADHVTIGEGVILGAQSGVPSKKRLRGPGILFWGTPARPIQQYLRELASLARLTRRDHPAGEGN